VSSLLERALAAAQAAGEFLQNQRPDSLEVGAKSTATDAVTEMDRASEELLVRTLLAGGPDDSILGEEGGARQGSSGVRWVLDPLDGTVNYLYRLPEWAVSIAAEHEGHTQVGVVHCPQLGRTYWAERGAGSWCRLNGEVHRVMVGEETRLAHALVGTGFGYDADRRRYQAAVLKTVIGHVRDIRRAGAAAIDLCRVADATLDGYYEMGLQPWDLAAGQLIVHEAGGLVGGLDGQPADGSMTVASNRDLFGELASVVRWGEVEAGSPPIVPNS